MMLRPNEIVKISKMEKLFFRRVDNSKK